MSIRLSDIARKLEMSNLEFLERIKTLKIAIPKGVLEVDNETAKNILEKVIGEKKRKVALKKISDKKSSEGKAAIPDALQKLRREAAEHEQKEFEKKKTKGSRASETAPAGRQRSSRPTPAPNRPQKKAEVKSYKDAIIATGARQKSAPRIKPADMEKPGDGIKLELPKVVAVKDLAEMMRVPVTRIITELMKNGVMANLNENLDYDTAAILAEDLGYEITLLEREEDLLVEENKKTVIEKLLEEDNPKKMITRPSIISVMGHVDHGKTSLLDYLRKSQVAEGEAGGITQSIGAYQLDHQGKKITFLDTPGHEAFSAMRARGAQATDVAILVVAANDGVKPQTIEAINHAKLAGIPIVVAINKMDLPEANPMKVKQELSEHDLITEEWGGKTVVAEISAKTGAGIDKLLELVVLTADIQDLKADPERAAIGTVIESHLDPSLGATATILVNTGTLHKGDNVVIGSTYGKIRLMRDFHMKNIQNATPSTPVFVSGISEVPKVGELLQVKGSEKEARDTAAKVRKLNEARSFEEKKLGFRELAMNIAGGKMNFLKLVIKADTKGSLEALKGSIEKIQSDKAKSQIVHSGVGDFTESDISMAASAGALVLGFNVGINDQVRRLSIRHHVEVKNYLVIYEILEDVQQALLGIIEPEYVENMVGELKIKAVFWTGKGEMVVGGKVKDGKMVSGGKLKVYREDTLLGEGKIISLQRNQETVKEIPEGEECGVKFAGNPKIEENDRLECWLKEEVKSEPIK